MVIKNPGEWWRAHCPWDQKSEATVNNLSNNEKREFSRVPIHIAATIKSNGKEIATDATDDISMKGLSVHCEEILEMGASCDVILTLKNGENPVEVKVKGMVARCMDSGMAIQFTELDLESYDHLHNMVILNAEDPGQIEKEFKEHVGLKKR